MPEPPARCTLTPVDRLTGGTHPGGILAPNDLLGTVRDALRDRYAVAGEIGRGGMAVVCRATDLRHGREVAIKVLLPELARAVTGDRFLREISILARLAHPNILPLLDSGTVEVVPGLDVPWYVMPYIAEETLRARLDREGALPVAEALRLTRELCEALTHAHRLGIVHRDIKPENILLPGGQAVLADFGIARAVTLSGTSSLSSTGLVIGTPAYMSPEQSAGSEKLDARSDLYSLGVVLYEMLAGQPPFTGATPQAISARHQFEAPPPIRVVRPSVPAGLEVVLGRLLEKVPADRYGSAEEVARAVGAQPSGEGMVPRTPEAPGARRFLKPRWLVAAGVAVGLGIAAVVAARPASWFGPALDPTRVAVLPFRSADPAVDSLLNGEDVEKLIHEALEGFHDFARVDRLVVGDAIARSGAPTSLDASRRLARSLGAGRFIWGEITRSGDSIKVRGLLFQSRGGSTIPLRSLNAELPYGLATAGSGRLVDELSRLAIGLVVPEGDSAPIPVRPGTTSYDALRAYLRAEASFRSWELDSARSRLREALRLDPSFPRANLRLAQIGQWVRDSVGSWRPFLQAATRSGDGLGQTERLAAEGLQLLADSSYAEACTVYHKLVAADSSDFVGWFGLGECNLWDEVVGADPRQGGRLGFRGSYAEAQRAYLKALQSVPLAHRVAREVIIPRLFLVLPTSTWLRPGRRGDQYFSAWTGWEGDTIAFHPIPTAEFAAGRASLQSPSAELAFQRSRATLKSVVDEWTRLFPSSGPAWGARAAVLERLLVLKGDSSAVAAVERALSLTSDSSARARLMIDQARLALKTGDFALAGRTARSVLDSWRPAMPADALRLAPLAALVGRTGQLVALLRQGATAWEFAAPDGTPVRPPPSLAAEALTLYAYAVMGSTVDSVRAQDRRVSEMIRAWASVDASPTAILALTETAARFAFPLSGPLTAHTTIGHNAFLGTQLRLVRRDCPRVAVELRSALAFASAGDGGELSPESAFGVSSLLMSCGDSVNAFRILERGLGSLEYQDHLTYLPQGPAFLRRSLKVLAAVGHPELQFRAAESLIALDGAD